MYDDDEGGMPPLPTVEECQQFMEAINTGRSAIGLPTLAAINYDEADPGNPKACLSATYLFNAEVDDTGRRLDGNVGTAYVTDLESSVLDRLEQATRHLQHGGQRAQDSAGHQGCDRLLRQLRHGLQPRVAGVEGPLR